MQDRRELILDAALTLLARHGYSGLTHRAVDAEAGIPSGSTTYYFPRKLALVEATAVHLAELMSEDCASVKLRFADLMAAGKREEAIDYVAKDLLAFSQDKRDWLLARFELALVGARDESLAPIAEQLEAASRELTEFFLKLLSDEMNDEQIDACVGILDGLAMMHATGRGPPPTKEQIKRLFLTV